MLNIRNLSDIGIIESVNAPSTVPPNTPFQIEYTSKNISEDTRFFYGVILDENNTIIPGTQWSQNIGPNATKIQTDSFLGITQDRVFTLQLSHDMLCPEFTNQYYCENAGCYWWSNNTCHSTPEHVQPEICDWIDAKGGPNGLTIQNVFELIDSYLFQTPPPGYSFIPTIQNVFGVIDYYLGFNGDASTGCSYF